VKEFKRRSVGPTLMMWVQEKTPKYRKRYFIKYRDTVKFVDYSRTNDFNLVVGCSIF
jgi:hypothetical protein